MNSKNERRVGINEARPILGDLITQAQQGTDIILTRHGRPAARLTAYQEDTMTTTTSIYQALTAAGIDPSAITETPDNIVTAVAPDGAYARIGDDGQDEQGQQWWTATRYDADGAAEATDSWATLDATARAVAAWLA